MNEWEDLNRDSYRTQTIKRNKTKERKKRKIIILSILLSVVVLCLVVLVVLIIRDSDWNKTVPNQESTESMTNSTPDTISLPEIYKDNEIIGTWRYDEYNQYTFNSDGTGFLMADDIRYDYSFSIDDGTLALNFQQDVVKDCEYEYDITDSGLTLIGGKGTDGGSYSLSKIE